MQTAFHSPFGRYCLDQISTRRLLLLLFGLVALVGAETRSATLEVVPIEHPPARGGCLSGVVWDGAVWIVVGGRSTILCSSDGRTWQPREPKAQLCFSKVTSCNGVRLALTHCSTVAISRDGWNWAPCPNPGLGLRSMTFGHGAFVAVGDGGCVMISADAIHWTPALHASSTTLLCVRYAEDRFVAVGTHGEIVSSTDGSRWTRCQSPTTGRLNGLAHG